ncbi:GlsB/YeaQ/YmgE family stress response membrane protein [Brachybacterium sp. J144]|uniref:GlsB/YeaQ/YmgE family stress response membrane protein n=1 Tax=unclassified Brachybacterium TaxID=2623841 RepID=UPI002E7979CE|nr:MULTISPECIES: GlsB/YeaQ/YmgE family stress response membrane protein [unclassified Brachybacterium]MEE1617866.1 GlsB/YeaQ/YmgE family stress response membrane protein [Brachybacterium sp. J153]MEE1650745.1 GlsB/YeaQ/YmgE family stress response membrane protein [Brachybacterium sp. J144]
MGFIGALISWLIIGAVVGLIARAIMPGKQHMGIGPTIVLGVVGALVGGFIGGLFGPKGVSGVFSDPWSVWTIVLSVIGALIVMVVYGLATGRRR